MNIHNFTLHSLHAPTVLPRVALIFSRRGITLERFEMFAVDGGLHAVMCVAAHCDETAAERICAQLRRIVEISKVNSAAATTLGAKAG